MLVFEASAIRMVPATAELRWPSAAAVALEKLSTGIFSVVVEMLGAARDNPKPS